jgi:hypothetical protein
MHKYTDSGVLFECDECFIQVKKKIRDSIEFEISENSKQQALELIIKMLFYPEGYDKPQATREKITQQLIHYGQFGKEEINDVFNKNSVKRCCDFSPEFCLQYSDEELARSILSDEEDEEGALNLKEVPLRETQYQFPIYDCEAIDWLKLCPMKLEVIKCPDCGYEIMNAPQNVTYGAERNLVCPVCQMERENEFDTKGLARLGNPCHHGSWITQEPEFHFMGTDYFMITHPECEKSQRNDKRGVMLVNGVWCDNKRRVVLSLKCMYCGATNALKPFIEKDNLQLLDQSGAKWKRVESPLEELIGEGESYKTEFKSSLLWSYRKKEVRKELQYDVVRSIASFMNSEGGTLLIGVSDTKEILGLEKDYEKLGNGHAHRDGFENRLTEEITKFTGKEYRKYAKVEFFDNLDKKEICVVTVIKSPLPVILRYNDRDEFIVRNGNRTQKLDIREALSYIKMHWESY